MALAPAALWHGRTGLTASFRHPAFRALWAAGLFSTVGQWTLLTGRSALAHHLSGNTGAVGLVVFAQMLPNVFVPPIGGVIADRFNRRTVINTTLTVSVLSALVMAGLTLAGMVTVWQLFLLSLVNGMARAVEMPSNQAMVPGLVEDDDLLNAVALTGVVTHGSRLLGPLVSFMVTIALATANVSEMFTVGVVFVAATVLYGTAWFLIRRVPRPVQYAHPHGENPIRQLADGVHYTAITPVVGLIMLLVLFHCGLTMSYDALMPMYASDHMGHGDEGFQLLMMTVGAGSMVGTLLLAGVSSTWHRGRMLLVSGLLSGLSPAALSIAMHWSPALVAAAFMGASQAVFMALTNAFLQTATPDRYRGRVLSLFLMVGGGVMAFGNLGAGYLGDHWGVTPTLALPAIIFTSVMIVSTLGVTARTIYRREAMPVAVH